MRSFRTTLGLLCIIGGMALAPTVTLAARSPGESTFHATYKGTASLPTGNGKMIETIVGIGKSGSLGSSTIDAIGSGPINPGGCIPLSGHGHLSVPGSGTIRYRYKYTPCFRPMPPGSAQPIGAFTITGGSGKFKGATGTGTYTERYRDSQDVPPGKVTITFAGTLNTP